MTERARVLLTRPRAAAEATAAELAAEGLAADIWPLTEIAFLPLRPDAFASAGAYVFTSANGVKAATRAGAPPRPALCVGPATSKAAMAAGFGPVETAAGDGAALLALCRRRIEAHPEGLLHIRGEEARVDIAAALAAGGAAARALIAYRADPTKAAPQEIAMAIQTGAFSVYAFYSPRSALIFTQLADSAWTSGLSQATAVAISAAAAAPLDGAGFKAVRSAATPTAAAMRAAICGAAA